MLKHKGLVTRDKINLYMQTKALQMLVQALLERP